MSYNAMSRKRFPGQQYQSPLMMQPPSPTPSGGGLGFGINGSQGSGGLSDLLTSLGIGLLTGRNPSEGLGLGLQQANVMAGDRRQERRYAQRDAQDAERFGFEKQKYQTELGQQEAAQADTAQRTEAFGQYVQQMPVDAQTKQFILSQGPDSPAGQQIMKSLFPEAQGASSTLGKLADDLKAGRISQADYDAAVKKENYIRPEPAGGGLSIDINGDGVPDIQMGSGKFTEGQGKDFNFANRLDNAMQQMTASEAGGYDPSKQTMDYLAQNSVGGLAGNWLTTDAGKAWHRAGKEAIAVILRKDTGAAVTDKEFDLYGPMYLPMPFDPPAVKDQKKQAMTIMLQSMRATSGAQGIQQPAPAAPAPTVAPGADNDPLKLRK